MREAQLRTMMRARGADDDEIERATDDLSDRRMQEQRDAELEAQRERLRAQVPDVIADALAPLFRLPAGR